MSNIVDYATAVSAVIGALAVTTRSLSKRLERNRNSLQVRLDSLDTKVEKLREEGSLPIRTIAHHLDRIDRHLERQDRQVQSLDERLSRVEGRIGRQS